MTIDTEKDLDGVRAIGRAVKWLAVSLVLVAGPADSLDQYLVIVNRSDVDTMVSYRPGVFQGPGLETIAMLNRPMQAPAKNYDKIRKYWRLPEERIVVSPGTVTITLAPGTAAVIGGVWPPTGDPPIDGNALYMKIDGREATIYENNAVVGAFAGQSRKMRVLEVR